MCSLLLPIFFSSVLLVFEFFFGKNDLWGKVLVFASKWCL